jgi:multidrug efflux pump subunit AcrA (membrane-fusion protein)
LALFAFAVVVAGCNARATPASAEERARDFIRLDPGNPRLNYVKVEVQGNRCRSSVQLTGRVSFDERPQRVASPIDGRVTKILVQLGIR